MCTASLVWPGRTNETRVGTEAESGIEPADRQYIHDESAAARRSMQRFTIRPRRPPSPKGVIFGLDHVR